MTAIEKKPIDCVTIDRLELLLPAFGIRLSRRDIDILIDIIELIEDNDGGVTLADLEQLTIIVSFDDR